MTEQEATAVKVAVVIGLTVVLVTAVVGLTIVAVTTDRDLWKAEVLTFSGIVLLAGLGGLSWWRLRAHGHRWRVNVQRNGEDHEDDPDR